jgi:hypothetical protein
MASKKVNYGTMMESAFETLKNNLILFLPNLIMITISISLLLILYNVGGLRELFLAKPFILNNKAIFAEELAKLLTTPKFTITTILWFVGEILLGAYFVVMKYGMIRDIVTKGKTSLKNGMDFADHNYLKYWSIHIIAYLLIYGPFFILLGIYSLFVKYNVPSITFGHLILGVFVIAWLVYALLMGVRIFYIYPVMAFEKKSVFETFDDDFHYVKTHMGHTFLSFLIVIAFVIGLKLVQENINIFSTSVSSGVILISLALLMLVLEIIVSTWEHIFVFKSYEEGKQLKKLVKTGTAKKAKKKKKAK